MTIKEISVYTKGKAKMPMAQICIIENGRSYTRHAKVVKDGYIAYWPPSPKPKLRLLSR